MTLSTPAVNPSSRKTISPQGRGPEPPVKEPPENEADDDAPDQLG